MAPVVTLWREPRAMAALLVPVVTVVPVPMVTLAIPLALPAVTVGMPERLALPGSARFRAPTVLVPMAATVARAVMARTSRPVPVLAAPAVKAAMAPPATAPQGPQGAPAAAAGPEGMVAQAVTEPVPRESEAKAATGVTAA